MIDQLPGATDVIGPTSRRWCSSTGVATPRRSPPWPTRPDLFRCWSNGVWRHLYGAAWAEAAVLAAGPTTPTAWPGRAWCRAADPVSSALLDRADALAAGDRPGLLAVAAALRPPGCRYQWVQPDAGGRREAAPGQEALAAMGATPSAPAAAFRGLTASPS